MSTYLFGRGGKSFKRRVNDGIAVNTWNGLVGVPNGFLTFRNEEVIESSSFVDW